MKVNFINRLLNVLVVGTTFATSLPTASVLAYEGPDNIHHCQVLSMRNNQPDDIGLVCFETIPNPSDPHIQVGITFPVSLYRIDDD